MALAPFSVIDEPGTPGRMGDIVDMLLIDLWMRLPAHERSTKNWLKFGSVEQKVRDEFAGQKVYVKRGRGAGSSAEHLRAEVRVLFNGRNIAEVAAQLCVSRATVYRLLKRRK